MAQLATTNATLPLPAELLPAGVHARFIEDVNGLRMHVLEAGAGAGRPLMLLLHGFPELAYSWRKVMAPLADAGFHVVAPDLRGYGRTTGWSDAYDQDLRPFSMLALARDVVTLVRALGAEHVSTLVGHDFGSPLAAWCTLVRPDLFRSVVLMSAPFAGAPALIGGAAAEAAFVAANAKIADDLARLPRPRKHYHWYYAARAANADMQFAPGGVHDFLRAYFHMKSADWVENKPFKLGGWTAQELAKLPTYYVMDASRNMAETVAPHMPAPAEIDTCRWMSETEMAVYGGEYARTGFQGGLNWYRTRFDTQLTAELSLFAARTIDVPSLFIAGAQDWGIYQAPGAIQRMQGEVCTHMDAVHLIEGAGHWVMQEQPVRVADLLRTFAKTHV
jgi:pimeloyl-ACP methyl ester carboxylesterase